jgi:hypothetical protein
MIRLRLILKNLLLAFVLVSIGFVLGKHSVHQSDSPLATPPDTANGQNDARAVTVYYMHATIRCVTCNTIEEMTRKLVDAQFGKERAEGIIIWQEVDFQKNASLAKQFGVVSSCVVVARMKGDIAIAFKRLDDVWTLMNDPPAFNAYVSTAIQSLLAEAGNGETP